MSLSRVVNRNKLKRSQKNNKIQKAWRYYQIKKYGIHKWCKMYNDSKNIKNKEERVTPNTAFYI